MELIDTTTAVSIIKKKRKQAINNLPAKKKQFLIKENKDCVELSLYKKSEITQEVAIKNIAKLKIVFSDLTQDFYTLLITEMRKRGFSNERFNDATDHVIGTCIYPKPTIAQFLSFNHIIETLTYRQIMKRNDTDRGIMNLYTSADIDGNMLFVRNEDFKKLRLKKWKVKNTR